MALHLSESSMEEDWKDNLSTDAKGNTLKTISNLRMIFTHDENLRQIRFDTFCQDDISFSPLFRNVNGNKVDEESVGKIQDYLEQNYDLRLTQNKVFEILKTTASERNFNPVQDYICKEKWDGNPRIETAIIDYLGAEDTPLIREQTKLWFVAGFRARLQVRQCAHFARTTRYWQKHVLQSYWRQMVQRLFFVRKW